MAVAFGVAGQISFAETVFDCVVKPDTNDGGVAPRGIVLLDESGAEAEVYDAFIHEAEGEPVPAKIRPRNANAYDLSWQVDEIPVRNRVSTTVGHFSAVLDKRKNTLSVRAEFAGFENLSRGRGKCKVRLG
ncbi:MAG: hypothetical protein HWE35_21935 [Rhodobacteraceae bacterium]|nr:hypothetical protein [Paracoccaceae bacterium]